MTKRDPLSEAELALRSGAVGIEDVLERWGPTLNRQGRLPELVSVVDEVAPEHHQSAMLDWMKRADLTNGSQPPGAFPTTDAVQGMELLEQPELLEPPAQEVTNFAWRERLTFLYGPDKCGKSTTMAAAAAAKSEGRTFLGHQVSPGVVLWANLEQHPGDLIRPFVEFGWDPEQVWFLNFPEEPMKALRWWTLELEADLVVVDTFHRLVEHLELEMGEMNDWSPVLADLRELAIDSGAAVDVIHHSRRSDDEYLGSRAIGAGVDMRIQMTEGQEATQRDFKLRGRWAAESFSTVLVERGERKRFEIPDPNRQVEEKVMAFLDREPGASKTAVRKNVSAKAKRVDEALRGLLESGSVVDGGSGMHHKYRIAEDPQGQATDRVGQGSGQGETGK